MTKQFLTFPMYDGEMRLFLYNIPLTRYYTSSLLPREPIMKNGKATTEQSYLACNLYKCQIGFLYFCTDNNPHCIDHTKGEDYIYIGITKSAEYHNFVMKLIPKSSNNKNIFSVIVCPGPTWLTEFSNSQYIETANNYLMNSTFGTNTNSYTLKYMYCNGIGVKTFVKCGYLKQKFMPSIDVGYQCDVYNDEEANRIHNKDEKVSEISLSNNELMCEDVILHNPSTKAIAFLPPGNNHDNVERFEISRFDINTKLYFGHRLHYLNDKDFSNKTWDIERSIGYAINYEPRCKVPNLDAKLRLRINGIVQESKNKTDNNSGGMETFTFLSKEMKNASIGCQIVLDKMEHSAFNNFYELLYSTSLSIFDETTKQYKEVQNIQELVSNGKYRCILNIKGSNYEIEKPRHISESEFIINLINENTDNSSDSNIPDDSLTIYMWIVFAVPLIITILVIVGHIIITKYKLKVKISKKDLSTSSSTSASTSQQITKSSTVISKVPETKAVNKPKNISKKMTTMNSVTSNEVTNSEQSGVSTDSSMTNKTKKSPIRLVAK
uniref:Tyrosine-protein phosphatase domain-containing protein n=1 Tax=Strongyloides papillosus TaxID=174720 RepID=A0A0N5BJN4_STREA